MPDTATPARVASRLLARADAWPPTGFALAVIRRFLALEILDRAFAIAAQAFVALLPLEIVLTGMITTNAPEALTDAIGVRFALAPEARAAVRSLFAAEGAATTISWLAVAIATFSALALSRRLARAYGVIFDVPPIGSWHLWRGFAWILLQLALLTSGSWLREVKASGSVLAFASGTAVILLAWTLVDFLGMKLLVPKAPNALVAWSTALAAAGRVGLGMWASTYMPRTLPEHSAQYGPIGVTFLIFTYLLGATLVYVCAPLLVTTWVQWRAARDQSVEVSSTKR